MGFLDVLTGKRKLAGPAPDRLFAITTAYVTMQTGLGINSRGSAAIVFQPLATADFESIVRDMEEVVKATAGGHMVGEQFSLAAGKGPRIEAQIDAPNTIVRVDVVKDGKYIYTTRPNSRSTTLK